MGAMAPAMLTAEQAATLHPAPPVTEGKIRRLRLLARNPNPKIRESIASSYHAPEDVFADLAHDPSPTVRSLATWKTSLAATQEPSHA